MTNSSQPRGSSERSDADIFLNTGRVGNLTRLILALSICVAIHTYIHIAVVVSHVHVLVANPKQWFDWRNSDSLSV